jgi:predicted permease
MLAIFNTTSILFITILLGFVAGISGLFKRGDDQVLINYVFYIALPLNLFLACYHTKWQIFDPSYLSSYSLAMLVTIAGTYFISRKFLHDNVNTSQINTLATSQVDGAYFTMPLFLLIFKSTALAVPLMLIQNLVFFTASLLLLQLCSEQSKPAGNYLSFISQRSWQVLIHNPIISLSLLGLAFNFIQLPLPNMLTNNVKFIGSTASAVALFSLGMTCAFYLSGLKQLKQIIPLASLSLIKLLLFPLCAWLIGRSFNLSHELMLALVLLCASPAATHTYIIANKYESDAQVATFNVVITTLLSFVTINLWLYWLN